MKKLVLPDVHHKVDRVLEIISHERPDKIISLGDWHDDFNDDVLDTRRTSQVLRDIVALYGEDFILLIGNHDLNYWFPAAFKWHRCSGNTKDKVVEANTIISYKDVTHNLQLVYYDSEDDIVYSHAGISRYHYLDNPDSCLVTVPNILYRSGVAMQNIRKGDMDQLFQAGYARYGDIPVGGPTWLDWNREFQPLDGINQIVGHTICKEGPCMIEREPAYLKYFIRDKELKRPLNSHGFDLNLDTNLKHYAIIENGEITIKKYAFGHNSKDN